MEVTSLAVAEFDRSSMLRQILKLATGHCPEMEDSGQLHASVTLPTGRQLITL
jgi:hypothetical protein